MCCVAILEWSELHTVETLLYATHIRVRYLFNSLFGKYVSLFSSWARKWKCWSLFRVEPWRRESWQRKFLKSRWESSQSIEFSPLCTYLSRHGEKYELGLDVVCWKTLGRASLSTKHRSASCTHGGGRYWHILQGAWDFIMWFIYCRDNQIEYFINARGTEFCKLGHSGSNFSFAAGN